MPGGGRPPDSHARIAQAHALHRQGRFGAALAELDSLGPDPDGSRPEPFLRAALLARLGRVAEAIAVQREAIAAADHPRARLALAGTLRAVGDIDGSAEQARAAIDLAPAMGEAWWTLANIKTVPLSEADRAAMRAALTEPSGSDFDRACLHFALAYALEQAGENAEGWEHLTAANALRAREVRHRPEAITALVDATIAAFGPDLVAARRRCGDPSGAPIFIVGMPRAGSTLLEQMLAAGGEVEPLGELPAMIALARSLGGHERLVDASYLDRLVALP
ncbi:MAG: sulfotransferase, partial [Tsuneonella sp.]